MTKKINRLILYICLTVVIIIYVTLKVSFLQDPDNLHRDIFMPIALGVLTWSASAILEQMFFYGKYFYTIIKCRLLIPNKKVYVSISYLIRIKIPGDNLFLLVKGNKIDQYQPVGGVYKIVGGKNIEKDWRAILRTDRPNPRDLRFFINAKELPGVLKWFKSGKDREIGIWREFKEELIDTNILSPENFGVIRSEYIKTVEVILKEEKRFSDETYHTLLYDVFEIELTENQTKELLKLKDDRLFTDQYAFVNETDINSECFNNHQIRIGQHTKNIL